MKKHYIVNLNLISIVLILLVLGCTCSSSNKQSFKVNTVNQNEDATSIMPYPSPPISPTPKEIILDKPEFEERIKKGEAIYKRIVVRTGLPIIFGWRGKDITIPVTTNDWNGLSKQQQVDLTYYVESLLLEIKSNPIPYATRWASYYKKTEHLEPGGEYDGLYSTSYFEQVRELCNSCWSITIGNAKRDGFYDESTPVSGGTVEEFRSAIK